MLTRFRAVLVLSLILIPMSQALSQSIITTKPLLTYSRGLAMLMACIAYRSSCLAVKRCRCPRSTALPPGFDPEIADALELLAAMSGDERYLSLCKRSILICRQ